MRLKRQQIIERDKKDAKENSIWSWVRTIALSVMIGLVIVTVARPVLIYGSSMYPTMNNRDFVVINRIPYVLKEPQQGDIIVFKSEMHTLSGAEKDLIKRVIAVSGDSIEVSGGKVFLNGEELDESYIFGGLTPGDVPKTTIQEGYVFVMGDNRPVSLDSRDSDVGQVAISEIKGKVLLRLFPFDKIGTVE